MSHSRGNCPLQGFQLDDTELKEYTHLMLSNVASGLGHDFAPYLPVAMAHALQSLNEPDTNGAAASDKEEEGSVSLNSQEDSEIEEADGEADRRTNLRTGEQCYL